MKNRIFLALSFSMLAMFSASEAHADEAINFKIEKAERLLLGKTASDQPVESRLDAVEMNLYGKTKHGSVVKRMDAISDFLGIKDDSAGKAPSSTESKSQTADAASNAAQASGDFAKVDQAKWTLQKPTRLKLIMRFWQNRSNEVDFRAN